MRHPFIPMVLLVLLPLGFIAYYLGWLHRRSVQLLLAACGFLVLLISCRAGGVDFTDLNRMKLGLAAVVTLLLLMRRFDAAGMRQPRRFLVALALLSLPAGVVYCNFFAFHGTGSTRVYVHLHDVAHYYLGSKYFSELGYSGLYTGMLRAEAELYENHFKSIEARDLETNALLHIRALLVRSDEVKNRFTGKRWSDFKEDVRYFRDTLGAQYGDVLRDHGFNPTPVWALIGGALANLIPAGSERGILLLTLLDPLLLAGLFAAIWWAFGLEAFLLSLLYFCIPLGASFGWTGGGYLRYTWFFALIVGVCCLRRRHYVAAGMLLAASTSLRIFPAFFAVGLSFKAAGHWIAHRRFAAEQLHFFLAFFAAGAILLTCTLALPRGLRHWDEFRHNMQRHVRADATNIIGLGEILAFEGAKFPANEAEFRHRTERRRFVYGAQLLTVVPIVLLFVALRSRHEDDVGAAVLGIPLLYATLNLASYYYVFLLLLVLIHHRDPSKLLLIFACEAITYWLALFEDRDVVQYLYRSLLVGFLLTALYVDSLQSELQRLRLRTGSIPLLRKFSAFLENPRRRSHR
jgi:hypothetical protein